MTTYIIFIGTIIRIILALLNSFYKPLVGADMDAIKFHQKALLISEEAINFDLRIGWIYSSFLGLIYKLTFGHILVGSLISVFGWLISALIVLQITKILKINETNRNIILFIFTFFPSTLIFTSVTLREPFQLLFLSLVILSYLKIFIENKVKYNLIFFISLLGMCALHKIYLPISIMFICVYFLTLLLNLKNFFFSSIIFSIFFFIIYFYKDIFIENFLNAVPIDKYPLLNLMETHINNMTVSRASYYYDRIILSDFQDLFEYSFKSIYNYFIQPTPVNQKTFLDLLLFSENIFRLFLILMAIFTFLNFHINKYFFILLLFYICIEICWALGTNNWGTAVRHHIPSLGLLLILSFYKVKLINR